MHQKINLATYSEWRMRWSGFASGGLWLTYLNCSGSPPGVMTELGPDPDAPSGNGYSYSPETL